MTPPPTANLRRRHPDAGAGRVHQGARQDATLHLGFGDVGRVVASETDHLSGYGMERTSGDTALQCEYATEP